jgi:hypothetical protein
VHGAVLPDGWDVPRIQHRSGDGFQAGKLQKALSRAALCQDSVGRRALSVKVFAPDAALAYVRSSNTL